MAEKRTAAKEPMSLNQRHNRLLFNISSDSHSKPPFQLSEEEEGGRMNLSKAFSSSINLNDDVPTFSGIADFDSPSPPPPHHSTAANPSAVEHEVGNWSDANNYFDDSKLDPRKASPQKDDSPSHAPSFIGNPPTIQHQAGCGNAHANFEEIDSEMNLSKAFSSSNMHEDSAPHFSGMADLNPSPTPSFAGNPSTLVHQGAGSHKYSEITSVIGTGVSGSLAVGEYRPDLDEINKAGVTEYVPTYEKKSEFGTAVNGSSAGGEYRPSLCKVNKAGVTKYVPPSEEGKPPKVKLDGRRRLCKTVSSNNDSDIDDKGTFVNVEQDFTSPTTLKREVNSAERNDNEIRDILNDLSAKFEVLSMEKRPVSKKNGQDEGFSTKHMNEGVGLYKEKKLGKSSDPLLGPDNFDSFGRIGSNKANVYEDECESEGVGGMLAHSVKNCAGDQKNRIRRIDDHLPPLGQSDILNHVHKREDSDDDDDCVVISNQNFFNNVIKRQGLPKQEPDDFGSVKTLETPGATYSVNDDSIVLMGSISQYRLPGKIAKMLYPHQRDGLKWLWSLHCQGKGGILGDDMGLGKTMQICSFLAGLFHSRLIKRVLVVAPKTLLPHWIKELSAVDLSQMTREYYGTCAKARQYELQYVFQDKGVLLTTYDTVRNNAKSLQGDHYFFNEENEDTWDYMVLDEGHLIKNPSTQRAKSLLEIPATHRIIISGTPIQNHLKELWALFSFCCPELLGDKKWFKEKYENAILRGNDKNASDRDKRIGSAVAKELRERIQPYFLRRLKSEVFCDDDGTNTAKLSQKHEIIVWLKLTACQRQLYEAFLKTELVVSAFDGSPLAALTILKKICDHPLLLTKRAAEDVLEGMDTMLNQDEHGVAEKLAMHIADVTERLDFAEKHDYLSCKISFILSLLASLIPGGHNVLIFSQTRKMLDLIQDSLTSNGFKFLRIDGTTKANDRLSIVNDFQEGGAPIFLLTSQVGGLGLTLTKADRVIVVDPAWNPSTDNQSVDRAYRIGQKKDVLVYRLMTCGTVEEKIYRKQVFKGGLFKSATEQKEQIRYFSQQDLRELFSIPEQGFDVSLTQQQLHDEHDCQLKMEKSLEKHIKFVESLGIAGVSHHSLLFSKTAPVTAVQEEQDMAREKTNRFVSSSTSFSSIERDTDGAKYAFNPKDAKLQAKVYSSNHACSPNETDIKERIKRLSHVFANKVMISNLPDKGDKIRKQIAELQSELENISLETKDKNNIINLDDISG